MSPANPRPGPGERVKLDEPDPSDVLVKPDQLDQALTDLVTGPVARAAAG